MAYDFVTATCGPSSEAGRNTNRSRLIAGGTTTTYCYDDADRLTSSSDPAVGTPVYDNHGNTTTLGNQTLGTTPTTATLNRPGIRGGFAAFPHRSGT